MSFYSWGYRGERREAKLHPGPQLCFRLTEMPDRNVSHTDDAVLLLYRTEQELGGGCSLRVKT